MGKRDAIWREDGWGNGDERSDLSEVGDMGNGKGGWSWIVARGE